MTLYMAPALCPIPGFPPPISPPSVPKGNSVPMLYYGLILVGTAAIVLAMYSLIFMSWSRRVTSPPRNVQSNAFFEAARSARRRSFENLDSFNYKKQKAGTAAAQEQGDQVGIGYECAVCLSAFEDGEEVRKLPRCKHLFHAPCIDMWLYSHSDCPLCRTTVPVISWCQRELTSTTPEEHSREVLLVSSSRADLQV